MNYFGKDQYGDCMTPFITSTIILINMSTFTFAQDNKQKDHNEPHAYET